MDPIKFFVIYAMLEFELGYWLKMDFGQPIKVQNFIVEN